MPPNDVLENDRLVQQMRYAILDGEKSIKHIPVFVKQVLTSGAWKKRFVSSHVVKHERFIDFVSTPPLDGMGWDSKEDLEMVAALLREDPEAEQMWREATTGQHGGDRKSPEAPIKNNNVILDRPVQGNSRAYTLDRLKRERPDLFKRVKTKELSANAASIEAGFRKRLSPFDALQKLIRKSLPLLSHDECEKLRQLLE